MTVSVVTPPAYYPVSLQQAKDWCRIDDADETSAEDAILRMLIAAMTGYAENLTHRAFVERTLKLTVNRFPLITVDGMRWVGFELPYPPLLAVESIVYVDLDGESQTLATDQYVVHDWREPGVIVPSWDATWPSVRAVPNAIEVTYRAGYNPGSPQDEAGHQDAQPAALKLWLHARLATMYENREQLIQGNQVEIPRAFADGLLDELIVGSRLA